MNFDQHAQGTGATLTRLTAVAVIHLLVGAAIVAGIAVKQKLPTHFMPDAITRFDPPPPKPEQPAPKFDLPAVNPPPITSMPLPTIDVAPADVITPPAAPPTAIVPPGAVAGGSGTGEVVKTVAKGKPVLGKGSCETPAYPANAAREGATGTVRLALLVGINGRVTDAKVEKSSGHRELDKAARIALSTCRFTPVTVDGVPEATWTVMEYIWTLD